MEKADILELTVNHVQKLHQQGLDGGSTSPLMIATDESTKFRAGFSECARLVRDVLQSQMESAGVDHRTSQHLERCLANLDRVLMVHQTSIRSPSPSHCGSSSSSESCSSFEGKDTVLLSPQSTIDRASPVTERVMMWSAKSAFVPSSYHRRRSNSGEVPSSFSPDSSVGADHHPSDGSSTPSSALTAAVPNKWHQRQVATSPTQQQQQQQHGEWQMSDAHVMELRPPCGRSSTTNVSSLLYSQHPFNFSTAKTNTEDARVWRPW